MRAKLADVNHCAVPFLCRAAVNKCLYYLSVSHPVSVYLYLSTILLPLDGISFCLSVSHPVSVYLYLSTILLPLDVISFCLPVKN